MAAYCHEFITKLPQGYEAILGENVMKAKRYQQRALLKMLPLFYWTKQPHRLMLKRNTDKRSLRFDYSAQTLRKKADKIIILENAHSRGTHSQMFAL